MPELAVDVDPDLTFLLPPRARGVPVRAHPGATDTLGHVVSSLGIPLPEVGALTLDGRPASAGDHATSGMLRVAALRRPQRTARTPPAFLLDVHLGALARRLRLLGLDTAYGTDADDADLVRRAAAEQRVLLTQDRALLHRRALPEGALVRGSRPADQLDDVLDRFAPPLAPWTRCVRCNGALTPADAADVADEIEPGTRRTYRDFARCAGCGRVYWRGAHAAGLEALVDHARTVVAARLAVEP